MNDSNLPRILIVDDEEAILETMTYTFMGSYEVITADDPQRALALMDRHAPVAVVITDQRMPGMTGVELLKKIYERHPETVRIMLTGFADSEATIQAINDGHVYAYVHKPWEPDELKQVVKQAVERFHLSMENRRLVEDLRRANLIMGAVMDRLDTGAIAVDGMGVVQAVNRPARAYLDIREDPVGRSLEEILPRCGLAEIGEVVKKLNQDKEHTFEDLDLRAGGRGHRIRVSVQQLFGPNGDTLGRVLLFKEVSHEPLRRRFEEIVASVDQSEDGVREHLEKALEEMKELDDEVRSSGIASPSMAELAERVSRSRTAIESWLDVDDVMSREEYPDAQLLVDRMRLANQRWPRPEELPPRVVELARRVESYYESGENPRQRVL